MNDEGDLHDEDYDENKEDERGGETASVAWCVLLSVKMGTNDLVLLV